MSEDNKKKILELLVTDALKKKISQPIKNNRNLSNGINIRRLTQTGGGFNILNSIIDSDIYKKLKTKNISSFNYNKLKYQDSFNILQIGYCDTYDNFIKNIFNIVKYAPSFIFDTL